MYDTLSKTIRSNNEIMGETDLSHLHNDEDHMLHLWHYERVQIVNWWHNGYNHVINLWHNTRCCIYDTMSVIRCFIYDTMSEPRWSNWHHVWKRMITLWHQEWDQSINLWQYEWNQVIIVLHHNLHLLKTLVRSNALFETAWIRGDALFMTPWVRPDASYVPAMSQTTRTLTKIMRVTIYWMYALFIILWVRGGDEFIALWIKPYYPLMTQVARPCAEFMTPCMKPADPLIRLELYQMFLLLHPEWHLILYLLKTWVRPCALFEKQWVKPYVLFIDSMSETKWLSNGREHEWYAETICELHIKWMRPYVFPKGKHFKEIYFAVWCKSTCIILKSYTKFQFACASYRLIFSICQIKTW
jgi:hypothetical protein